MKKFLFAAGIVFIITLAVVIGSRMSADAMAVVVGIVAGIVASIPTSAILFWVLRQRERQLEAQMGPMRYGGYYPPVVVVNGQGQNGTNGAYPPPALTTGAAAPSQRSFKVIGQENTEANGDVLPPFWNEL